MLAELMALVASITTATATVMVTKGMKDSNPDTGNLVMTGIQTLLLTGLMLLNLPVINLWAAFWYALTGIFGSFIGRILTLISYKRIGVSAGSAITGTTPLVTTILAILFLGEPILFPVILGSVLVVAGIITLNLRSEEARLHIGDISLPLGAALLFAVSNIIRKLGTNIQPDAVLGAQISTFSGFLVFIIYLSLRGGIPKITLGDGYVKWLVAAGVFNALAWIAITSAISLGEVSVVSSIIYSYPLFSMLFSRFLLSDEALTRNIVIGCLLISLGVIIVLLI